MTYNPFITLKVCFKKPIVKKKKKPIVKMIYPHLSSSHPPLLSHFSE